jgi:hypothetical protein
MTLSQKYSGRSEEEMDGAQQDLAMQDEVRIAGMRTQPTEQDLPKQDYAHQDEIRVMGNRVELISGGSHHVNSIHGFIETYESHFKLVEASKRVTECLLQTSYGITPTLAAAISNISNVLKGCDHDQKTKPA